MNIAAIFDKDQGAERDASRRSTSWSRVPTDAYKILKGLKSRFEEHHKACSYTDEAIVRVAVELSDRYINRSASCRTKRSM
jgi:ATP-dependent Clp protease ATP-binding subunit ClpA